MLYGVAALPAGWLGDRWSQVGMIVIFFLGIGAGAIVTGLADGPEMIFAGLTLIGLFAAIYHPVGIAWLVASARKQGMSLGINGVFGNAGNSVAPVFVGVMIDYFSWRIAFLIPGIVAVLAGVALFVAWRRGWVADARTDRVPQPPRGPGDAYRVFVILTLTMACAGFVYAGLTNTMPKMFEIGLGDGLATSYTQIGLLVGVVSGSASAAGILGGWLADRFSARSIYVVFWMLQVPLLFVIATTTGATLLLVALLTLSFNLSFTAAENMLVAQYTPTRWRSLAYGAKFVLALGVAGLTVILAGWVFDSRGGFDLPIRLAGHRRHRRGHRRRPAARQAQTRPRPRGGRLNGRSGRAGPYLPCSGVSVVVILSVPDGRKSRPAIRRSTARTSGSGQR